MAVAAVEYELDGHVCAVREASQARGSEVNREAEGTLPIDLEEGDGLAEVLEALRVFQCRELNTNCGYVRC